MGDVIKILPVRSYKGERPRKLSLYFDSGSPYTLVKKSVAGKFKDVFNLSMPKDFYGLGNGNFYAPMVMMMEVNLIGYWCKQTGYVVQDDVLENIYDALVGHDFMQNYNVKLDMRRRDIILDKGSLRLAQKIRNLWRINIFQQYKTP